jgi:hypothetical protein
MKIKLDRVWKQLGIPTPKEEFYFAKPRGWRFDYAWPDLKIALEVEGGAWVYGRHNYPIGFLKDMEKYNQATLLGWKVFRFTPRQFEDGTAAEMIQKIFNKKE